MRLTRLALVVLFVAGPLLAAALFFTAGARQQPTPTPTLTPTAQATFTPRPTFTPTPAPTVEGTATPASAATATPTPSRTPSPTAAPSPAATVPPSTPTVLGWLQIPKLKVDAAILPVPIVNGDWDTKRIVMEVGWLAGTAQIGSDGNIGMAAHVSLKCCGDGPFRWLEKVVPGDEVTVRTATRVYNYRVTEVKVVEPTEISVLKATERPQLTLITCYDWDYFQASFTKRFVVIAHQVP